MRTRYFKRTGLVKNILLLSFAITVLTLCQTGYSVVLNVNGTYSGTVNGMSLAATATGVLDTSGQGLNHIVVTFSSVPYGFHPYALSNSFITFYCPSGVRPKSPAKNMWDLSQGNYSVSRSFQWPDYPDSNLTASAAISTVGSNMTFTGTVNGTYDGPNDLADIVNPIHIHWNRVGPDTNDITENNHGTVLRSGGSTFEVDYSSLFSGLTYSLPAQKQFGEYRYYDMTWNGSVLDLKWMGYVDINPTPTVSQWGLIVLAIALLSAGGFMILRRGKTAVAL